MYTLLKLAARTCRGFAVVTLNLSLSYEKSFTVWVIGIDFINPSYRESPISR